MTKNFLVKLISETLGYAEVEIRNIINMYEDLIISTLVHHNKCKTSLGVFKVVQRKSKISNLPNCRGMITGARKKVVLKMSTKLNNRLNKGE